MAWLCRLDVTNVGVDGLGVDVEVDGLGAVVGVDGLGAVVEVIGLGAVAMTSFCQQTPSQSMLWSWV